MCPLGDIDCLTAATRKLISDENLHSQMADEARKWAAEQFHIDRIVPQYEAHYERMIEQTRANEPVVVPCG